MDIAGSGNLAPALDSRKEALNAWPVSADALESLPSSAQDEWRFSAEVDIWGFWRKGDEPWKQFQAVDLVRCGSRGKPFWHAEAQAGSASDRAC